MPTKLRKLRITKVDLCGNGANPDADILIFKSRDEVEKRDIPASHRHQMPRSHFAGPHESFPIEEPGDVKNAWDLAGHAASPDAVRAHIRSIAHRLGSAFVAALPDSAKKEDRSVSKPKKIDVTKATPDELRAYSEDLEKALEAQEKELAKKFPPKKGDDDGDEDGEDDDADGDGKPAKKVKKFVAPKAEIPEEVRKRLDDAEIAVKKAQDEAREAREEVAKAKEQTAVAEVRKTIETQFTKLPGKVDDLTTMYRSVQKTLSAEEFKTFETVLKAGHEAIAKASAEIGSSKGAAIGSAQEELMTKAQELVDQKVCKSMPEAVNKVASDNPTLYERYREEKRTATRR